MTIDWWTFALQALNFLILVWLLKRLLYKPVKEIIAKRKALADEAFAEAEKREAEADVAKKQYEDGKAALAGERQALLKKLHEEADAERQATIKEAKAEAAKIIDDAKAAITKERGAALKDLQGEMSGLALDMAAGLIKRADLDIPQSAFLERIDAHLKTLPKAEMESLRADLTEEGAELTVVTAQALKAAEKKQWLSRLQAHMPGVETVAFKTRADILGGAELHAPHAVIRFTWADQLAKAREAMSGDDHA
ncbi:hypothetical protein [Kordiimonas marina]|uniref:F0F1 ATP synthase subunit B family protein n=1 Tax=Kordiimonas marina TaxID=2872312 RepID=UPI001FF5F669|nr:hypothetical protein [Kordiimonas marina]MCJ9428828.1 hypothetical protein [Kordiimonas marina]